MDTVKRIAENMGIIEKVSCIQRDIKAPKNLYNKFGKYKYRNAEGILEAFKPYEKEYKVMLLVEDEIENIGNRFYVKATATIYDCESDGKVSVKAYAREEETKKGMDGSQITGSASSYARKYALNGLLLLDDTKDADTEEQHTERTQRAQTASKAPQVEKISNPQIIVLKKALEANKKPEFELEEVYDMTLKMCGASKWEDITVLQFKDLMAKLTEDK